MSISSQIQFSYAPWADNFDGTADGMYSFKVPPASSEGEIEIYASWWNSEPCLVIWKYQAQDVNGTADQDASPDPKDEIAAGNPVQDVGGGRELGEAECARMQQEVAEKIGIARGASESYLKLGIIGVVAAQTGDSVQDYCSGGEGPLSKGSFIKIGDCI